MRKLRDQGYKLGICTNNVREWEPLWRAKLPVDEIFSVVVDSAFVGSRKPEPRIYEITLERLGRPRAAALRSTTWSTTAPPHATSGCTPSGFATPIRRSRRSKRS